MFLFAMLIYCLSVRLERRVFCSFQAAVCVLCGNDVGRIGSLTGLDFIKAQTCRSVFVCRSCGQADHPAEREALEPTLSENIIKLQITDNHALFTMQGKSKSF